MINSDTYIIKSVKCAVECFNDYFDAVEFINEPIFALLLNAKMEVIGIKEIPINSTEATFVAPSKLNKVTEANPEYVILIHTRWYTVEPDVYEKVLAYEFLDTINRINKFKMLDYIMVKPNKGHYSLRNNIVVR
ncbi:MAG: hypothetical protein EOL86_15660 [Deltaproteobacteria bacterium]|nr:hypothetical protein [Deltaproteobacteria bacterium]